MSEVTAEDLDSGHRKSGSNRRDVIVHLFPLASHHLLINRGDHLAEEDGEEEEETMEIYEEFQVLEEVEVSRGGGGGRELIVTLEKIVTEETVEILYPDRKGLLRGDRDQVLRASVSSI